MNNSNTSNSSYNNKRVCRHPCFNNYDFHNAIIHLPIASESNINSNYSLHQSICSGDVCSDAVNTVLTPYEAMERLLEAKKSMPNLTVAAIAGPGEALANFEVLKESARLIRQTSPETLLCLSTNGLMLPVYANHLISLGFNYVTVTVNTISPEIGANIYNYITYLGHRYYGVEGANILLQNQISGISYLASMGISVRMNIEVVKGINDSEIKEIVYAAKECGCKMTNILQKVTSGEGNPSGLEAYTGDGLSDLRKECESILPQSYYCKPCNSTTMETLNSRIPIEFNEHGNGSNATKIETDSVSYRFAVCSKNGKLIDQHFGQATKFYIYDYKDDVVNFVETRQTEQYCHGSMEEKAAGRIYQLIKTIEDCNCVICMKIGACPSDALKEKDIDIYITYNLIEEGLKEAVLRLYTNSSIDDSYRVSISYD
ncbi:NifB/NifX family molybdenum-iron cluster-binding protein [Anaerosporobacter sp.]